MYTDYVDFEKTLAQLQDAMTVTAGIQSRHARMLKDHDEWLEDLTKGWERHQKWMENLERGWEQHQQWLEEHARSMAEHDKRMAHIDMRLAEITDKLDGLIGYMNGYRPQNPPQP